MDRIQKYHKSFYDKNAGEWARLKTYSFWAEIPFGKFVRYFKKGDKIIDLGCGYGRDIPLFLGIGRNLRYEGFDISRKMLALAEHRYPQLKFYYGNILNKKTLPKTCYSGFWSNALFQHIPRQDWPLLMENVERLIMRKGIGCFSLPKDRLNEENPRDRRHFSIFNRKELRSLLELRGWRILESGKLTSTSRRTSVWTWYIVRLP